MFLLHIDMSHINILYCNNIIAVKFVGADFVRIKDFVVIKQNFKTATSVYSSSQYLFASQ